MLQASSLNMPIMSEGEFAPTQQMPIVIPEQQDDTAIVAEVQHKYDQWRQMRRPYEVQWYLNASALRGFPDVRFNAQQGTL